MKRFLCYLVLTVTVIQLFSQESKLSIGIGITPSMTKIRGFSLYDLQDPKFSVAPGLYVEYNYSSKITFLTGIEYETKGVKSETTVRDNKGLEIGDGMSKYIFEYLSIPILASLKTKGKVSFYGEGGLFIGYLLSMKYVLTTDYLDEKYTEDNTDGFRKLDVGLSAGFGIETSLSEKLNLNIGLRDNLGLLSTSDYASIRTNSLGLLVRVKYNL